MSAEILTAVILVSYIVFGTWLMCSIYKKKKRKKPKLRVVRDRDE